MGARESRERREFGEIDGPNKQQKKKSHSEKSGKRHGFRDMDLFRRRSKDGPAVPKALLEKKALFLQSIKTEQMRNARLTLKVNQKCIGDIQSSGDIRSKHSHVVSNPAHNS